MQVLLSYEGYFPHNRRIVLFPALISFLKKDILLSGVALYAPFFHGIM